MLGLIKNIHVSPTSLIFVNGVSGLGYIMGSRSMVTNAPSQNHFKLVLTFLSLLYSCFRVL